MNIKKEENAKIIGGVLLCLLVAVVISGTMSIVYTVDILEKKVYVCQETIEEQTEIIGELRDKNGLLEEELEQQKQEVKELFSESVPVIFVSDGFQIEGATNGYLLATALGKPTIEYECYIENGEAATVKLKSIEPAIFVIDGSMKKLSMDDDGYFTLTLRKGDTYILVDTEKDEDIMKSLCFSVH